MRRFHVASVEDIIQEWRQILQDNPDKFTKQMVIPRKDIEAIVKYFDDIDSFRKDIFR